MDLYLITGFLGAGKTTFLKNFIRLFAEQRLYLIINEFGKVGVDGALLRETGTVLSEINNGSIFCACRLEQFEHVLENAVSEQPDVIIVEASGLSDPTSIRKMLSNEKYAAIHYKGSICLVDAVRFEKVVSTARVCPKQLVISSLVVINKTDLVSEEQLNTVISRIRSIHPAVTVVNTSFGQVEKEWLRYICPQAAVDDITHRADITLQKSCITVLPHMRIQQLQHFLTMFAEDTYRIKGFVFLENQTLLVDCVGPYVQIVPYTRTTDHMEDINQIVALAGAGMPLRKSLQKAIEWYGEYIGKID